MFEFITQESPHDYQSLEILKEAYSKLSRQNDAVRTSKRIAEAYLQLGQLSSAILEYESILQRLPDDPDVSKALADIEQKAASYAPANGVEVELAREPARDLERTGHKLRAPEPALVAIEVDDGKAPMRKVFVDGKLIAPADFDALWPAPDLVQLQTQPADPFIQRLADRGILPPEMALKALIDKTRLSYLPLDRYDVDVEFARQFPRETCLRWCVLPFDKMGRSVMVATANPYNKQAAQELERAAKTRLFWYLCLPADLSKMLRRVFR
jgi:tetratricopeptide (TPR) repeat protein